MPGIDRAQVDYCRLAIPALHVEGAEIVHAPDEDLALTHRGARLHYTVRTPHGVMNDTITCSFAGGGLEPGRLDLTSVETTHGRLSEIRLYILKEWWLTPQAQHIVQAPPPDVMQLPRAVALVLQHGINALPLAALYGLLAAAYALVYGLIGRINLAFGELAVIGGYGAVMAVQTIGALAPTSTAAAIAGGALNGAMLAACWAWLIGRLVVGPLAMRSGNGQPALVATVALALSLQELLRLTQGARERWLPGLLDRPIPLARANEFIVSVTGMQMTVASIALVAGLGLAALMHRSGFGRDWRASADDPLAARLFGVAPGALLANTFMLAGMLAGLTGAVTALQYGNISFSNSLIFGLKALVGAILGGINSVPGAMAGGALLGLLETTWSASFDIASRDIAVFVLLIGLMMLRPAGLFGQQPDGGRSV